MIWPEYGPWEWALFAALVAVALTVMVLSWRRRWRNAAGLSFPSRERTAGVPSGVRARLYHLPLLLRFGALALVLVAMTRPQQAEDETAEVEGIDIVVAFDLSGSMSAVDISDEKLIKMQNAGKEPNNRFESARGVLRDFIESRQYDRVSLVVFGKQAFLQFPLTLDYGVMLRIVDAMKLGDIDGSATAIGNALGMSLARLRESEAKTKIIILLTDGEDNGSTVSPTEMAEEAARREIRVFTILVGSEDQSREPTDLRDAFTGQRIYKKVENPVNPALLERIAAMTNARFYRSTDEQSLKQDFLDIIETFEKSRLIDTAVAERSELFARFLFPALALLLLEILLGQTWLRRFP